MKPVKNTVRNLVVGEEYKVKRMPTGYQQLIRDNSIIITRIYKDVEGRDMVDYRYVEQTCRDLFTRLQIEILEGVYL